MCVCVSVCVCVRVCVCLCVCVRVSVRAACSTYFQASCTSCFISVCTLGRPSVTPCGSSQAGNHQHWSSRRGVIVSERECMAGLARRKRWLAALPQHRRPTGSAVSSLPPLAPGPFLRRSTYISHNGIAWSSAEVC